MTTKLITRSGRARSTDELTPQQQAVADHPLPFPALVDAGAGTGKTYTIVERVAQLDADPKRDCPASSILLLTFSRKAAAELRGRIVQRLGPGVDPPECATFHAFALSLLKEHAFELDISPDFTLINEVDARVIFWRTFDEFVHGAGAGEDSGYALRFGAIDDVVSALFNVRQQLRDRGIAVDEFVSRALAAADAFAKTPYRTLIEPRVRTAPKVVYEISNEAFVREVRDERARVEAAAALFRGFDERLRLRRALTYADLLDLAEKAIHDRPDIAAVLRRRFRHCIVDEYQDTDPRQIRLLGAIFGERCERVMVVGDPRQSIYGFRGIQPSNVTEFGNLPSCVRYDLTHNRRSRQEILDLAHTVIAPHSGDAEPLLAVRGAAAMPVIHVRSHWQYERRAARNAAETREVEARWVASKIAALLEAGHAVERPDKPGVFEPLAPRHIAVLSRRKTKLQPLIEALNALNLPFRQYGGAGFYEAPEVLDALAWFRLVADPLDDLAVARVLASPGIGISDATLTVLCRDMDFGEHLSHRALVDALPADLGDDERDRLERLRRTVDALDAYAGAPLVVAWEAALDRAGLMLSADARSGHRHDQARANLEKLSAMVRGFSDRNPGARPPDFIRYIRELSRVDADDQEADPPSADAINVMTIHAAKGLEWPFVFLIDVWLEDVHNKARVWIDAKSGALLVTEGADGCKPFHAESIDRQDDGTGEVPRDKERERDPEREREERRLFYVGLTRARDELFVSGNRRPPSSNNPDGRVHAFLGEVIHWVAGRAWGTIDEPFAEARAFTRRDGGGEAPVLPLRDFIREGRAKPVVAIPVLSFSSIAQYEQCPRSLNYRVAYHLPGLADDRSTIKVDRSKVDSDRSKVDSDRSKVDSSNVDGSADGMPADSLLSLGAYGELVHRALELWGRESGDAGSKYVSQAIRDLDVKVSREERERAIRTVDNAIAAFAGKRPALVEAPFTIDFDGIAVAGFIDLVLTGPDGRAIVVDYKTGITEKNKYGLQLALYRQAAVHAYGLDVAGCKIARINADGCTLEDVDLPDERAIRTRVAAVARGIRSADITARPGTHCALCPFRAAPCMDYTRADQLSLIEL